jgi:hypothetical protein
MQDGLGKETGWMVERGSKYYSSRWRALFFEREQSGWFQERYRAGWLREGASRMVESIIVREIAVG